MDRFFTTSRRRFSPLTTRILAVNVAALMILVLGLLSTGQYERGLIAADLDAMKAEGRLLAAALSDGGTRAAEEGGEAVLDENLSRLLLRRLSDTGTRVILFSRFGGVMMDSHVLQTPDGGAQLIPLDSPFIPAPRGKLRRLGEKALDMLPVRLQLPPFPLADLARAQDCPGVPAALRGETDGEAWTTAEGGALLTTALPVRGKAETLGALFIMRSGARAEAAVREVQISVFKVFGAAFLITVLLCVYLSETIVRPIVRLADATTKMRQSLLMKDALPDLSWRRDEIGDLSRAFRDLTAALAERIDAISRFASDVAHEIKNPLASVKSAVETFARVREPGQQEKLLSVINHDIDRINRLITDISNASRMDSELGRAEKEPLDMGDLLQNIVAAERARTGRTEKIALHIEEGRRLRVTGNATQLAQVFHNLIDNALSFTPLDGVVEVRAMRQGDRIVTQVDNPGPPIPENKLEAVFERFYSERPKDERFGMHSGLGLSISRQIVRMHRGEISAQNLKNGAGVRFTVILPAGAGTK